MFDGHTQVQLVVRFSAVEFSPEAVDEDDDDDEEGKKSGRGCNYCIILATVLVVDVVVVVVEVGFDRSKLGVICGVVVSKRGRWSCQQSSGNNSISLLSLIGGVDVATIDVCD